MHRRWSFPLRSSADALWPYVSNTDRLNRAIGQSSVEYTDARADGGASTRSGTFRLFGMEVEWREYPFEWVADAGAWAALKRLDVIIDDALHEHRGVLVPAPLGIYGVAFISTEDALLAALAVQAAWHTLSLPAPLRASIHEGPCIAATRGDRVEYFGKTVHRTVGLLDDAPPGGVVLSDAAAIDRDGAMRIRKRGLSSEVSKSVGGSYAGLRITKLHPGAAMAAPEAFV